jgi:cystathionine gamma-synthase
MFHNNKAYSVAKFLENLEICIFAESLGGTETFITFPYTLPVFPL